MSKQTPELIPCPCCGKPTRVMLLFGWWRWRCAKTDPCVTSRTFSDRDSAVRACNTRVPDPVVERLIEALRQWQNIVDVTCPDGDFAHDTWNPNAHIELTATVQDYRNTVAALAPFLKPEPPDAAGKEKK
ncbi:MAG: hypothetical protein U0990_09665 [Candidatus Nanopelagicales bacterium]|nr:hypothetical protein [Candidatus Nanopelagicales bacterium]